MKASPVAPTTHKTVRQPKGMAINATNGASIFPRSPAKLTVPTAVDRPRSS